MDAVGTQSLERYTGTLPSRCLYVSKHSLYITHCVSLGTREHVTASLLQLHWLPVHWRVQFKLCCLVHPVFHEKCPDYLANVMSPINYGRPRRSLRSLLSLDFSLPWLHTKFGERAFTYAGRLHGTHYRRTYVLSLILDFLETTQDTLF